MNLTRRTPALTTVSHLLHPVLHIIDRPVGHLLGQFVRDLEGIGGYGSSTGQIDYLLADYGKGLGGEFGSDFIGRRSDLFQGLNSSDFLQKRLISLCILLDDMDR